MRQRAAAEELDACRAWRGEVFWREERPARLCLGGVLSEWVWGPVLECGGPSWKRSVSPRQAPTSSPLPPFPRLPPLPSKNPPPRKPLGAFRPQPPRPPSPGAPHRDRPTHLKGPWLPGLPPSRRLPPHLRAALFITSAPIPGPPGASGLRRCANRLGDLCAPRGGGEINLASGSSGEHFPKLHVPGQANQNPSALSLPPASHQAAQAPRFLEPS